MEKMYYLHDQDKHVRKIRVGYDMVRVVNIGMSRVAFLFFSFFPFFLFLVS